MILMIKSKPNKEDITALTNKFKMIDAKVDVQTEQLENNEIFESKVQQCIADVNSSADLFKASNDILAVQIVSLESEVLNSKSHTNQMVSQLRE